MDKQIQGKIATFFHTFPKRMYKKGEILIHAQEHPQGVFYLEEGFVKEYFFSKKGEEIVVNIFKPGVFFPMSYAFNDGDNLFSFEAETPLTIYKAPTDQVVAFLQQHPDVLFDLLRRVYRGVDGLLLRMVSLMSGDATQRVTTELLIHAKRFGKQSATSAEISFAISEKELASQSGLTRETISRELKRLKEAGLVFFSHGIITIPSLAKLEESL